MRYVSSTIVMDEASIRDLMVETVEYHFGPALKLPCEIQWLTGNDPCYTERETVEWGRQLGFEICTTLAYSLESNGMVEAFVKTFKPDYV